MTDLEKLVEKRAGKNCTGVLRDGNYDRDCNACRGFKAGATDPVIRKAIELRERAKVYLELFEECREADSPVSVFWSERNAIAEAELAQLMAGIEEKA